MILSDPEPPPAYVARTPAPQRFQPTLAALPEHVLLDIISRLSLTDLHGSVRRTSRRLYLASTHLLRQWLLPSWNANLRGGWGSDPLGLGASAATLATDEPIQTHSGSPNPCRKPATSCNSVFRFRTNEGAAFDLFVATCALELAHATASALLDRPSFTPSTAHDLFTFLQPRARVADLVVARACEAGLAAPIDRARARKEARDAGAPAGGASIWIWGEDLGVQLGLKKVDLLLPRRGGVMRVVVEVERGGRGVDGLLAECVDGLRRSGMARRGGDGSEGVWYEVER